MNDITRIPYGETEFDKKGMRVREQAVLPTGVTDLFVISHGWNNNKFGAEGLYHRFFENFASVESNDLPGRHFAIIGVI